jgi:hypothetical protein
MPPPPSSDVRLFYCIKGKRSLPNLPRGKPKLMRATQTFPFNKRQLQKISYANNEDRFLKNKAIDRFSCCDECNE